MNINKFKNALIGMENIGLILITTGIILGSIFMPSTATADSITLHWTAPGDDGSTGTAAQYDIRYLTSAITDANWNSATQANGEPEPHTAGTTESFTIDNLQSSTTYYFAIKASDESQNWSALSNNAIKATGPEQEPPSVVTNLATANPTVGSMTLIWTAPGDDGASGTAAQYDIRYSATALTDANWGQAMQIHNEPAPQVAGTQQSVTINGLTENTTYYFGLKTADEVQNWSTLSNIASGSTSSGQDLTAPGNIQNLLVSRVSADSITLSWTAPGDDGNQGTASAYSLRYSTETITTANWGSCTPVSDMASPLAAGSPETRIVTGLSLGVSYYFAIITNDEVPNYSALSNIAHGTTDNEHIAPATIANLHVTQANDHDVTLSWTAPGDDGTQGTASQYDIRYSLSAITEANWDAAAQATDEPVPLSAGQQQTFTVTDLQQEIRYYFAIKTADDVPNWSALSNVTNVLTPDQTPPAAIGDLVAVTGEELGSVSISWSAPGDDSLTGVATGYVVKIHTQPITEQNWESAAIIAGVPAPETPGTEQNYTIPDLSPGQLYYVAMVSTDNYTNESGLSNISSAEAKPFGADGIEDGSNLPTEYNLSQNYPNPFNPSTNIEFSLPEEASVILEIYDSMGRRVSTLVNEVYPAGYHSIVWNGRKSDGATVSTGMYFCRIIAEDYSSTKKMTFLK
jgi:hypothetical protein